MNSLGGVNDIVERDTADQPVLPPAAPSHGSSSSTKQSRFKSWNRRVPTATNPTTATTTTSQQLKPSPKSKMEQVLSKQGGELNEHEKIHLENIEKMAEMSTEEIEHEREELLRTMDPGILQALLRRAEAAEIKQPKEWDDEKVKQLKGSSPSKDYAELTPELKTEDTSTSKIDESIKDDDQLIPPSPSSGHVHFPKPAEQEDFLDELHTKYFPDLAIEQDKLAWMRPVSEEEDEQEYSEFQDSLAPSELRFDFQGKLITPRQSRQISTDEGLHHHGDAPLAAGYTIAELAHLARSSNYSQRCIALRTLGRILYRMGKLQYGKEITSGLYGLIEHSRVHESLLEACDESRTRSVAVRAYATEALWLWKGQGSTLRPAV